MNIFVQKHAKTTINLLNFAHEIGLLFDFLEVIILGSCGFSYKCHKQILSREEFLMIGNPMLLCRECQEKIEQLNIAWDKAFREERRNNI